MISEVKWQNVFSIQSLFFNRNGDSSKECCFFNCKTFYLSFCARAYFSIAFIRLSKRLWNEMFRFASSGQLDARHRLLWRKILFPTHETNTLNYNYVSPDGVRETRPTEIYEETKNCIYWSLFYHFYCFFSFLVFSFASIHHSENEKKTTMKWNLGSSCLPIELSAKPNGFVASLSDLFDYLPRRAQNRSEFTSLSPISIAEIIISNERFVSSFLFCIFLFAKLLILHQIDSFVCILQGFRAYHCKWINILCSFCLSVYKLCV